MTLQTSLYKQILKEKFNLTDNIEEIVSKNPNKYCIDKLYNINDLPKNKTQRLVLKSVYQNTFIPLDCIIWIEQNTSNVKIYEINKHTKIYIISDKEFTQQHHIFNIVNWISKYSKPKKLDLFIFLTPFNKIIKYKGQLLTRNEINSGVCYKYKNWVQIFRSEELLKVLIHELLHYYDLDINNTEWVDNILPINLPCNSLLLNEAITEAMAVILHTHYFCEVTKQDFKLLIKQEITYSKKMHDIILYHYNVKTFNDIFNICQYTNVISYYIIKYILIEDIDDALKYLFDKTKIKKYIITKLINYFNNDLYLNHNIKQLNYEISAKMSYLNLI
jgi:hypothetical protein